MKRAQHTEHCRRVLGEGFPQVHDYLDQYADTLGPAHREKLHNIRGVGYCMMEWGPLAAAAACLHIWADQVGLVQTPEGNFEQATIVKPTTENIRQVMSALGKRKKTMTPAAMEARRQAALKSAIARSGR